MSLGDVVVIAEDMVARFGSGAAAILDKRALDHEEAGDIEGARLWHRVALAAHLLAPSSSTGPASA